MEKEARGGRELRIWSEVGRHKRVLRKCDVICLKILENQAGCSAEKGLLMCSLPLRDCLRNTLPFLLVRPDTECPIPLVTGPVS